ncbi:hypothetical protein [Spirillospora sp. NPDC048823]|uniref:hypothetical protein n=1 Tax=unclassified Spirillospora TaxID=2642701 RepID=UPI003718B4BF
MATTPLAAIGSDERIKDRLKRDFPGWRFLKSDKGRWWAFRGPLPVDRMNEVDTVEANTPDGLHAQLKDVTAKATR